MNSKQESQGVDSHIAIVPNSCVLFPFDSLKGSQKLQLLLNK